MPTYNYLRNIRNYLFLPKDQIHLWKQYRAEIGFGFATKSNSNNNWLP